MDTHVGAGILLSKLFEHWLSALFIAFSLVTIITLVVVRWWLRRRWKELLEAQFEEENELDFLTPLSAHDQEAQTLIKKFRQEVWEMPEAELQLSVEVLIERGIRIVRSIAAVYRPEAETAEYEASLLEILQLIRRVSARLHRLGGVTPFNFLASRKISDYQRYYQVYRKINENPVLQLLKRNPHVYRVARWALNVKNLGNPLYWAGRELSREGYFYMLRWFYLTFISQVGREAMRLYSGRHFQAEEDRDAALVCYRLFAFTRQWAGPSPEEWSILVDYTANHSGMEAEVKVHILSRLSQDRLPKDLDAQTLQTRSGVKWYRQGLQRLLDKDPHPLPIKKKLIEQELADLEKRGEPALPKPEASQPESTENS